MPRQARLLWVSVALAGSGVLFYVLSVGGILFGGPSPPADLGVLAVTLVLVCFGLGTYFLRWARLQHAPNEPA